MHGKHLVRTNLGLTSNLVDLLRYICLICILSLGAIFFQPYGTSFNPQVECKLKDCQQNSALTCLLHVVSQLYE